MTILITGAAGFTGRTLIQHLISKGEQNIFGLVHRRYPDPEPDNIVSYVEGDLLDKEQIQKIITNICPERIIHLAGIQQGNMQDLLTTNIVGTQNLLDAVRSAKKPCRIVIVSSSAVYGYAGTKPVAETILSAPRSIYGISKAAQEMVALLDHVTHGSRITIVRPFNLIGPGQPVTFVCGRIISQIAKIQSGLQNTLNLFEIQSRRDFIDVRDAVRAYEALVNHPDFDTYCDGQIFNVGSGNTYSISEVIHIMEKITGTSFSINLSESSQKILVPTLQSDNTLIEKITAWYPEISLEKSLADMLAKEKCCGENK
jgi:GDP-4-dehydro-6-deoxy-D-mannose reductase